MATIPNFAPDFSIEKRYTGIITGIDEAGRGPWAGPVVASAVILDRKNIPEGIGDSKKLSAAKREKLFPLIQKQALFGIGIASVEEIDTLNILGATKLAMRRAIDALPVMPDIALIDGNQLPDLPCKGVTVVKGDSLSLSIAAASIIAKVTRDHLMQELAIAHPHFAWERNAGYGTKAHQDGLKSYGITPHHRKSFAPIRKILVDY